MDESPAPVAKSVATRAVNIGFCELELQLILNSLRRLAKVTVTHVIRFPPYGLIVYVDNQPVDWKV